MPAFVPSLTHGRNGRFLAMIEGIPPAGSGRELAVGLLVLPACLSATAVFANVLPW